MNERQIELAYEGKRVWDLKRWLLYEGGAGFDPNIGGGFDNATYAYNPEGAWGAGWRIYGRKDGRPYYTKANNVLTKLGLKPLSGRNIPVRYGGYVWIMIMRWLSISMEK